MKNIEETYLSLCCQRNKKKCRSDLRKYLEAQEIWKLFRFIGLVRSSCAETIANFAQQKLNKDQWFCLLWLTRGSAYYIQCGSVLHTANSFSKASTFVDWHHTGSWYQKDGNIFYAQMLSLFFFHFHFVQLRSRIRIFSPALFCTFIFHYWLKVVSTELLFVLIQRAR